MKDRIKALLSQPENVFTTLGILAAMYIFELEGASINTFTYLLAVKAIIATSFIMLVKIGLLKTKNFTLITLGLTLTSLLAIYYVEPKIQNSALSFFAFAIAIWAIPTQLTETKSSNQTRQGNLTIKDSNA
ncbi:MAG: hypothetical protein HRT35_10330 [Algicola sp.]|nr:hypothetical protein [Algicola sp.]